MTVGDWVEMRAETIARGGSAHHILVNRRDETALRLEDAAVEQLNSGDVEPELIEMLAAAGFLADGPVPVPAPAGGRMARFLRTFDVRWRGANRWIVRLHDGGLHHAWRRGVIAAQCVLAAFGALALVGLIHSGEPLRLRPSPWEVPVYVGLSAVAIVVHELAHGLVVVHYGRRVGAAGFRLHLGSPAFYVDSVEALLLDRRQRIVQAAAGPWAEWLVLSVVAVAAWLLPFGALDSIVHRFVIVGAFTVATNLLPFGGLDGSLILADALREPELATKSRGAVRRLRDGCRDGAGLLLTYAAMNTVVSGALLATSLVFWWVLFGGIVSSLAAAGPLGWLAAAALLAVSFGPSLSAAVPVLRRLTSLDRLAFRLERRTRVRMTERFVAVAPFDRLDDRAASILAGQLRLHRVHRAVPLHVAGFRGFVATEGPLFVGPCDELVRSGVATVQGAGLVARSSRWMSAVRVGLLPAEAFELLGLDGTASEPAFAVVDQGGTAGVRTVVQALG